MSSHRYSQSTAAALAAGTGIVIVTFAFAQSTATSIIFALSIAAGLGALAALKTAPAERRRTHRALALTSLVTSAWTILVALGTFADREQYWIAFGGGVAIAVLSALGRSMYVGALERSASRPETGPRPVAVASSRAA